MALDKHPGGSGPGDGDRRGEDDAVGATLSTPLGERRVPVHWFAGRLHEVIDDLVDPTIAVSGLDANGVAETVKELRAATHRLRALEAAVPSRGEVVDVAGASGATSTQAWLAHAVRATHREARKTVKLAAALERSSSLRVGSGSSRPR